MNNDEIKYPIYYIKVIWMQNQKHPKLGYVPNRIRNSTGFYKMFKTEQSQEQLNAFAKERWSKMAVDPDNIIQYELIELSAEYRRHDTWLLTWFGHETYDTGQTDEEALNSFEQYVRKHEHFQNNHDYDSTVPGYVSLMGAEDRWRWYGYQDQDGNRTMAPCRCVHCKEQGLIRISH